MCGPRNQHFERVPQLGVKTATVLEASLCEPSAAGNVSVAFTFDDRIFASDEREARNASGTFATGEVSGWASFALSCATAVQSLP